MRIQSNEGNKLFNETRKLCEFEDTMEPLFHKGVNARFERFFSMKS